MRIAILICLLALVACSHPPRGTVPATDPARPKQEPTQAQAPAEERYRLEQEGEAPPADVEFEEDRLEAPEEVGSEGFDVESPAAEDVRPEPTPASQETPVPGKETPVPAADPNAAPSYRVVRGFRVQLAALTEKTEAESARTEAASRLAVPVYVVFEAPHYKVRAGDFIDRAEAVALQARARGYGYPEAWIVTTEVRISAP